MNSSDGSYLLHNFLFHLRTPLSSIKGASQIAKQMHENVPLSVLNWLEKWMPQIERWISAEEKAHSYFQGSETHDWKLIVSEMAENMKDISIAFSEVKALKVPESAESKMIFEMALHGVEHLNQIIQPIQNKDYQFLLQ